VLVLCVQKQARAMTRRYAPTILLYGLGLTTALSLLYNGFLLHEQHRQHVRDYEPTASVHAAEVALWQRQLIDCTHENQHKDSLIHQLKRTYTSKSLSTVVSK
jgi:hypothetical protein